MIPTCPGCSTAHDPRPCARAGATCDCCAALYASPDARATAAATLDAA